MTTNPHAKIKKADEKADRRRRRRAMTEDELTGLLDVARRRPLEEVQTVRRGKDAGKRIANVRPEIVEQREWLGRERALTYKALVLTSMRKCEITSLTVSQLHLDDPAPYIQLDAAKEKNRRGSRIPLRTDLADDLKGWLTDKRQRQRRMSVHTGGRPTRTTAD